MFGFCYVPIGYSHHIGVGDGVGQLSDLTNNNNGNGPNSSNTASGPGSGSTGGGSGSGDENGYVPQGYDNDQDYHSISEPGTHPGYVENSPEFYSSSLMDKAFPQAAFLNNKNFSRSECTHI
jgi:hypothetical protein